MMYVVSAQRMSISINEPPNYWRILMYTIGGEQSFYHDPRFCLRMPGNTINFARIIYRQYLLSSSIIRGEHVVQDCDSSTRLMEIRQ